VYERAPVGAVRREGGAWRVETPSREQRSDAVVLANGAGAVRLLRGLGVALPMITGKGYSRTFCADAATGAPRRAMYLESARVAISAFDGAVRISGGLGLGARRLNVSRQRLAAITTAAAAALPGWRMPVAAADWAGMRALAPDGLPYLGPLPGFDGLHVATAHAMLGITLAPLSGQLLADLLLEGRDAPARRAADPARALRRQSGRAAIA
jgi:D-amino-acid dehydrogenase